jgi:hypothetical protein
MAIAQIQMYELLKCKIGEKEAETFVQLISENMDARIDQRKHELATKEDISLLKENNFTLRAELLRTIYLTSMGQLIAIIASVVSLILVLKK